MIVNMSKKKITSTEYPLVFMVGFFCLVFVLSASIMAVLILSYSPFADLKFQVVSALYNPQSYNLTITIGSLNNMPPNIVLTQARFEDGLIQNIDNLSLQKYDAITFDLIQSPLFVYPPGYNFTFSLIFKDTQNGYYDINNYVCTIEYNN